MAFLKFLTLSSIAALANAYAAPGACSGACNVHDPGLIRRADGVYFRFSTGNKISYAQSSSIEGPWTPLGSVLPAGSSINLPGRDDLWAPDVAYVNGAYHVYYTVSAFGSQDSAIGLATSPNMEVNSWTDHGATGVRSDASKDYNAIDANVLVDDDGAKYMIFGSFWRNIYQVTLNDAATKSVTASTNIAFQPAGTHAREGAYLFKHGGFYYLFFSEGLCCGYDTSRPAAGEEYKIKVCRSSDPTGGFVDAAGIPCTEGGGTVVLESHDYVYGPGGQGVYQDNNLGPIIYYHYVDTRIGFADGQKRFGWNKLNFATGWPVVK
ncbi:glycosyl hydrolase [Aspergillus egyptiacus]|nr:glycosyl hydrolase [Aspergillus egyptiacus]